MPQEVTRHGDDAYRGEWPPPKKPRARLVGPTLVVPFELEARGGWPAVTGTVRPPTAAEVRAYYHRKDTAPTPDDGTKVMNEFFAGLIKSWDVLDTTGDHTAPIDSSTVARLPVPLWSQLQDVCCGYVADAGRVVLGN